MHLSHLFFKTSKSASLEAQVISQQLLERAGYIRKISKGIYAYTPLMWRVLRKLMQVMREELFREGAQEAHLPHMHPKALWDQTGRWEDFTSAALLYTLKDREDNEFCLGPTHEEVMTLFITDWLTSYKQLPVNLFQMTHKFRDEIRPRFGLMRCKEFLMKDGYSYCASEEQMEEQYQAMRRAYTKIFDRLGLRFVIVRADGGKIGKGKSEEFQVLASIGEDTILFCDGYACNTEAANALISSFNYETTLHPLEKIATPHVSSIDDLSKHLKLAKQLLLKTIIFKLLYTDREEFIAISIRSDREINPVKVANYFAAQEVLMATDAEIIAQTGARPGFAGPINLRIRHMADTSAEKMTNFVAAGNEADFHFKNVNWGRDCPTPQFVDFLLAQEGDECPEQKGQYYKAAKGIEVGHIFNLGTKYSEAMGARFQDQAGQQYPFHMGCYGIGIGRVAAACVEQLNDEKGIVWPQEIAPHQVVICPATLKNAEVVAAAEALYQQFIAWGFDPLFDDRQERLGFKLKDADLLGIPYKIIIGENTLQEHILEVESRQGEKQWIVQTELELWAQKHLLKLSAI